jgi:[ribosomal protein S18]-alanine N-acetyltransferase
MCDLRAAITPMTLDDVPAVTVLEEASFTSPWPASSYRHELVGNPLSHYLVVRPADSKATLPPVLAHAGYWLLGTEAHVVTLATHPNWRRRGLGEWLLLEMVAQARAAGAQEVTLEVRSGNTPAQALYAKLGFVLMGRRKAYYPDNREDALILTLSGLEQVETWRPLARRRRQLAAQFDA